MLWGLQPVHAVIFAVAAVVVAVVLYGLAPRLPAPLQAVMRLVCVWLVITSTTLLVLVDETLWHAVALGGGGLAAIAVIYLAQTRRKPAPAVESPEMEDREETTAVEEPSP